MGKERSSNFLWYSPKESNQSTNINFLLSSIINNNETRGKKMKSKSGVGFL